MISNFIVLLFDFFTLPRLKGMDKKLSPVSPDIESANFSARSIFEYVPFLGWRHFIVALFSAKFTEVRINVFIAVFSSKFRKILLIIDKYSYWFQHDICSSQYQQCVQEVL